MEWGYGSPSSLGVGSPTQPFDWGYGAPTPTSWPTADAANEFDTGYGSPYFVIACSIRYQGLVTGALPDNGGIVVKLSLTPGSKWPSQGPYHIRLIDPTGVAQPTTGNCYSGVPGGGTDVFTDVINESMTFVLPPLAPASYDLRLRFGPTGTDEILLEDAILITRRNHAQSTHSIRRLYPPFYKTGSIGIRGEDT